MTEPRTLPHNLEAERSVLGATLIDNAVYAQTAAILKAGDFFRVAHRHIYECIGGLLARGAAADFVTVAESLERNGLLEDVGGPAYVGSLTDGVPRATNVEYYAQIVREKALLRETIATASRLLDNAYSADPSSEVLGSAATEIARLSLGAGRRAARHLQLVKASTIAVKPVKWLWRDRLALGAFSLLGGREGIGKSLVGYELAARVTQGRLAGDCAGTKRAVVVVATEDSKEHTIVPRLMAAGADLDLVSFVVVQHDGADVDVVLPVDVPELERVIRNVDAVMVILDPLLSRLDGSLDSHKDAEARRALEPLAALANSTGVALLGLIHVNKSTSSDPLTMLMASRAFAAVARGVLFAMVDPDDEHRRLLGLAKSNLGRTDIPTLAYQITPQKVADTPDGPVWTGRLEWLGEAAGTIREAIHQTTTTGDKTATTEAAEWLVDFLTAAGGSADSAEVKRAGAKAGHGVDHLRRARERLRLRTLSVGFPRSTRWGLPAQSGQPFPTSPATATTATTGDFSNELIDCSQGTVAAVGAVARDVDAAATTGSEATYVRL